jgi:hypothetical protein
MAEMIFNIIELINRNSGCLLVLLTFVYVIGTLLILIEMKKSRLSLMRPFVNIYFYRKDDLLFLTIENIGNVACKDLLISFEPPLVPFCTDIKTVRFLQASGRISFLLGQTENFFKTHPLDYFVNISFFSIATKKKYQEEFSLDVKEINEIVQM